jgi:predicted MPP superfamily phosphohydrolase
MFHTIITLAYTIPNIYVFIRICHLFINKGYRIHYTIIYLLLASIYPLSNLLSDGDGGFLSNIFSTAANYILPFYLYLFLSVLIFDLFLLSNLLLKIVPSSREWRTDFKIRALSVILILSVGVVIAGVINFNTIRTSEYSIDIPGRSSEADHLRIAFAADFHLEEGTNIRFVERFIDKVSEINPDILIFGGDIFEGDKDDENMVQYERLFKGIKPRYGVFAVLGNHEHYAGQDDGTIFKNAGMVLLRDSVIVINSSFYLAGRNDSRTRSRMGIPELLKPLSDSLPLILVDHRPTEIIEISKTPVDIQLSGHTHNGQMFPINLITRKVYELSWGYRKIGNTNFFVTSGIRLWGPPVRTTGKSEIMIINVAFR